MVPEILTARFCSTAEAKKDINLLAPQGQQVEEKLIELAEPSQFWRCEALTRLVIDEFKVHKGHFTLDIHPT